MARVLLVEDNPHHVELARRVLAARGYEVLTAPDGESGLQVAREQLPDIILLDLGLPDVDGQTLLGWLRRVPELKDTPIIAVTAWPAGAVPDMVAAYGFDGYITKPIHFSAFADQIATYLPHSASA